MTYQVVSREFRSHLGTLDPARTAAATADALRERERQDIIWGQQDHDHFLWLAILSEETGECARAALEKEPDNLRAELVQVAAVALAAIECGDRNGWWE